MTRSPRTRVLYDGDCPLCRRSVRILRRFDWEETLDYVDARSVDPLPEASPPLVREELLEQMHIVTPDGKAHRGFAALRQLAWKLPMLWPVVPLMYLPGMATLGQRLYLWVARNRLGLVTCEEGVCHVPHRNKAS